MIRKMIVSQQIIFDTLHKWFIQLKCSFANLNKSDLLLCLSHFTTGIYTQRIYFTEFPRPFWACCHWIVRFHCKFTSLNIRFIITWNDKWKMNNVDQTTSVWLSLINWVLEMCCPMTCWCGCLAIANLLNCLNGTTGADFP